MPGSIIEKIWLKEQKNCKKFTKLEKSLRKVSEMENWGLEMPAYGVYEEKMCGLNGSSGGTGKFWILHTVFEN